jgi:hypothetical protein
MWLCVLLANLHAAEGDFEIRNLGESFEQGSVALVVSTPGVAVDAYMGWVEALENRGFDARLLVFSPSISSLKAAAAGVGEAAASIGSRPWVLAAHGYGGVLALLSGVKPNRMALVATPLSTQVTEIGVPAPKSAEGLPWPEAWIGDLPGTWLTEELAIAYLSLAKEMPKYRVPDCPTWLSASGRDPVAPPETVRLVSGSWPDRTWRRAGVLSLDSSELLHAQMLTDEGIAREMAAFLSADR